MSEDPQNPLVTLVVINYRGARFLDELLTSLRNQEFQDWTGLFIDNASGDGSLELVRQSFPEFQVVASDVNLGFARAGNIGARQSRSPYVVFLNTDLKLEPTWLAELLQPAFADAEIAGVASKMRLYGEPDVLNGVGGEMNRLGYTWDRGMLERDRGQFDRPAEVLFAPAAAALFRTEIFLSAGGFDERFFMYHEDVDLCWRLWLLGHRIVTAPQAVAFHHFSASTRETRGMLWREILGERNNIRSLLKNYERRNVIGALKGLLGLKQRLPRKLAQVRNLLWNIGFLPETLQARSVIQKRRVRADRELEHLIVQSKHVPIRL